MADVHDKSTRSYNMSRIRAVDTKPELIVRKFLFSNGFRYRIHDSRLPGRPDIVLPKFNTVVNVHGCFWHGHDGCKYFVIPKTRREWWLAKIIRTKERDEIAISKLHSIGIQTVTIFECELRAAERPETLNRLKQTLLNT